MRGSSKVPLKKCVLLLVLAALIVPAVSAQSGDAVGGYPVLAPTSLDTDKCYECHSDPAKVEDTSAAEKWKDSVHDENDVGCERCHSASVPTGRLSTFDVFGGSYRDDHVDLILEPDIAYKAPSAFEIEGETGKYSLDVRMGLVKQQSTAMCARCHGLTPIDPESPKDVFKDYLSSTHGQSVVVKGLGDPLRVGKTEVEFDEATGILESAVCTDCHEAHATKAKDDPASMTHKTNIDKACSTENCHGGDELAKNYGLGNSLEGWEENIMFKRGVLGELAEGNIPTCADCHGGGHKIVTGDDPESPVNPNNMAKTCGQEDCHEAFEDKGVFNVPQHITFPPDKDKYFAEWLVFRFTQILTILVMGVFIAMFGLGFIRKFEERGKGGQ